MGFRWLTLSSALAVALTGACSFEDRSLHENYGDNQTSDFSPPSGNAGRGGTAGSSAPNAGAGGTASDGSSNTLASGGSMNVAAGGSMALGSGGTGSAGMGGSGGSAPTGCAVPGACTTNGVPIGTGLAITPDNTGFVSGASNGLGIQGSVFTGSDSSGGGTTVISANFSVPGQICLSGVVGQVLNDEYARYWGALAGLNLAQVQGSGGLEYLPWSPTSPAGTVIGFRFTLSGSMIPPDGALRFSAVADTLVGPQYCAPVAADAGLPRTFAFTTLRTECWLPDGTTPMPANATIETLNWALVSNANGPVPFDFCISGLSAVIQ